MSIQKKRFLLTTAIITSIVYLLVYYGFRGVTIVVGNGIVSEIQIQWKNFAPTVAATGDNSFIATATHNSMSAETWGIIQKSWQTENVNEHNYKQIMLKYGYEGYLKHLGGVFAKYAGENCIIQVNSAEDLQVAAEYVWGLMTLFSFDYNSSPDKKTHKPKFHKWGANNAEVRAFSFYTNKNREGILHMYESAPIDSICSGKTQKKGKWIGMRTNCNCGVDSFLKKTSLYVAKKRNHKIKTKNLAYNKIKVGDLVDFYGKKKDAKDQNQWHHVAIVGEIAENGDIITYDAGNRFIVTGNYKKVLQKDYSSYRYYKVTHFIDLDQSTRLGSANSSGVTTATSTTTSTQWWSNLLSFPLALVAPFTGGNSAGTATESSETAETVRTPVSDITVNLSDTNKLYKMSLNRVSEGCCFVGADYVAVCDINVSTGGGDDNGTVCLYNRQTGERYESSAIKRVRNHSNSMTYDPVENKLLIITGGVDVLDVDLDAHKIKYKKHLKIEGHGISYDPVTDCFIVVKGISVYKYTRDNFYKANGKEAKVGHYNYKEYNRNDKQKASAQGLGAFADLAFIPFTNRNKSGQYKDNTILVYDIKGKQELTKLNTSYPHEIEDCMCSDAGDLYCSDTMGNLFNTGVNVYSDLGISRSASATTTTESPLLLDWVKANVESFLSIFKGKSDNTNALTLSSREKKIEESVTWQLAIAEDDSHGYSTAGSERYGQNGEYCCSTLSIMAWERLGVPVRSKYKASKTSNIPATYKKAGFKDVTSQVNLKTQAGLERGDILLNKHLSHTETYIGDGKVVGAHKDSKHPERGDQKGNEISVTPYSSHSYATVLRYCGD